uniref:Uncharacterized protein n=1 Tax=Cyprinus carpio carpio TaxID=630221 RepID=A0A9J7WXA0_CYPCA
MMRTLYDLSDLRQTGFGQPPPRHGLSLLWWFAHYCVQIDSKGHMTAQYSPENGAFGFKQFCNRERLLPCTYLKYYKVGNLRTPGSLPKYVTENYTGYSDNSNTDRIIVSFDSKLNKFDKIYVTQHSDQKYFDQNHTYHISVGLMKNIKKLRRKNFLKKTMNHSEHISIDIHQPVQSNSFQNIGNELTQDIQDLSHEELLREQSDHSTDIPQSVQHYQTNPSQSEKCCCALTCCSLLVLFLIIVAIVYSLSK